jgi:hypothetical protein
MVWSPYIPIGSTSPFIPKNTTTKPKLGFSSANPALNYNPPSNSGSSGSWYGSTAPNPYSSGGSGLNSKTKQTVSSNQISALSSGFNNWFNNWNTGREATAKQNIVTLNEWWTQIFKNPSVTPLLPTNLWLLPNLINAAKPDNFQLGFSSMYNPDGSLKYPNINQDVKSAVSEGAAIVSAPAAAAANTAAAPFVELSGNVSSGLNSIVILALLGLGAYLMVKGGK